jgi:aminoglycoside phosphotransferase (APT) family kinase protein
MSNDQITGDSYNPNDVRSKLNAIIVNGKAVQKAMDINVVRDFIQSRPGVTGKVTIEEVKKASKVGASSGIVIFKATIDQGHGPESSEFVLRHAPISDTPLFFEYDMARQYRVQKALQDSGAPVPEPLWLDSDGGHLGVPGYIMTYRPGEAPNPSAFAIGPLADASEQDRKFMIDQVMQALVKIHSTNLDEKDLTDFEMNAHGNSALEKCINWYWRTWEWINVPEYSRLHPVREWLLNNVPTGKPELMHGDATLHNYLFNGNRLVGVLDWEMSGLGRAEADIALQCVTNSIFAAPSESGALRPPSDEEWTALYYKAGGRPLEHFDYFKKLTTYLVTVTVTSLQRGLSLADRKDGLLKAFWHKLES